MVVYSRSSAAQNVKCKVHSTGTIYQLPLINTNGINILSNYIIIDDEDEVTFYVDGELSNIEIKSIALFESA